MLTLSWFSGRDSNPNPRNQNPVSYHWTTGDPRKNAAGFYKEGVSVV